MRKCWEVQIREKREEEAARREQEEEMERQRIEEDRRKQLELQQKEKETKLRLGKISPLDILPNSLNTIGRLYCFPFPLFPSGGEGRLYTFKHNKSVPQEENIFHIIKMFTKSTNQTLVIHVYIK